MENDRSDLVYSGPVIEFVAVANEYCSYAEQAEGFEKRDFIDKSRKILSLLYYKATLLPRTEPFYEEGNEKFVTEEDWNHVHHAILKKLGKHNDYPEVFDPVYRDTEDQVGGSIAEDMADIYQDLRDFLMVYRMGTVELMNDSLWECILNFEQYWGQKLVNSLRAIHSLLCSGENLDEEGGEDETEDDPEKHDTSHWIISQRKRMWYGKDE